MSKLAGLHADKYPQRVIKAARTLYYAKRTPHAIGKELGIPATVIRYWRSKYAWEKPPQEPEPQKWRCGCGKTNTGPRCASDDPGKPAGCGHIPPWAEKGAAA